MSFFQRILQFVANKVIVETLANSRLFQRMALRVHHSVKDVQKNGLDSVTDKASDALKDASQRVSTFTSTFQEKIASEMEALRKQQQGRK